MLYGNKRRRKLRGSTSNSVMSIYSDEQSKKKKIELSQEEDTDDSADSDIFSSDSECEYDR